MLEAFRKRAQPESRDGPQGAWECPHCQSGLQRVSYEGVPIESCPSCHGCYVTREQMTRIFTRQEYEFSEEVIRLAKYLPSVDGRQRIVRKYNSLARQWFKDRKCPKCQGGVARKFYTPAYLVEVEECGLCGLTWLDQHELELLQYLFEEGQRDHPTSPVVGTT